uniref:Resolvase, N terminal domain n=1 Tax=Candidatus Kentrum sp. FW TaxID=2126338 RepID=A0A450RZG7_9GAMM|nr:MAG: Resolvase, N terminal domain [Candidatus Kentron sp. FW]
MAERKLGEIVENAQGEDVLVFAEISRIGRTTLQVLEVLEQCAEKGVEVHIAKQKMVLDSSQPSRIITIVFGMVAEIEREFISTRTKEALAQRKASGKALGRPKGKAGHVRLDDKEKEIRGYIEKGISKRDIAKLMECSPTTLYEFLERRKIA